ncbi:hypothetical protein BURPS1710b_A1017 [Burkholderia pseudomallei 1710b]|uniref:Uncharacterized protein n=1 Tax=Burkholderia pseudomallei (strain 1710b) TaxID=320372 RepID=Q3JJS8_BURP1|nr:hypothetical protein BURPS1710b_A1017 [Burkholderia pseudomallei 1710b]
MYRYFDASTFQCAAAPPATGPPPFPATDAARPHLAACPRQPPRRRARAPALAHRQHRRPGQTSGAQIVERLVRLRERIRRCLHVERHVVRNPHEFGRVVARQVRDRYDPPLAPQQIVRKRRNVRHVNPTAHDGAALHDRRERGRHERADRCEDQRRIERLGRGFVAAARPRGAEPAREPLRGGVARARERINGAPLKTRDLRDEVRGRAESVQADAPRGTGHLQRPVADETRAQQRRRMNIVVAARHVHAKARVGDRALRIAAVDRVAGEAGRIAQVLAAARAVRAMAARAPEPRHADTLADRETLRERAERGHRADDLVPRNHRPLRIAQIAVDDVQIGPAHAARVHVDQQLPRRRHGVRQLGFAQPRRAAVEYHRAHQRAPGRRACASSAARACDTIRSRTRLIAITRR